MTTTHSNIKSLVYRISPSKILFRHVSLESKLTHATKLVSSATLLDMLTQNIQQRRIKFQQRRENILPHIVLRWLRDLRWSCLQSAGPSARRARSGCAPSAPRNTEQVGDKRSIQGPAARARERKPKRAGVRTLWRKRKMRLMGWVIIRCTLVDAMAGALLLLAPRATWSTRDGGENPSGGEAQAGRGLEAKLVASRDGNGREEFFVQFAV